VVEREGRLYATDALEEALRFVDALDNRMGVRRRSSPVMS
jgi:hypothetical protein